MKSCTGHCKAEMNKSKYIDVSNDGMAGMLFSGAGGWHCGCSSYGNGEFDSNIQWYTWRWRGFAMCTSCWTSRRPHLNVFGIPAALSVVWKAAVTLDGQCFVLIHLWWVTTHAIGGSSCINIGWLLTLELLLETQAEGSSVAAVYCIGVW